MFVGRLQVFCVMKIVICFSDGGGGDEGEKNPQIEDPGLLSGSTPEGRNS